MTGLHGRMCQVSSHDIHVTPVAQARTTGIRYRNGLDELSVLQVTGVVVAATSIRMRLTKTQLLQGKTRSDPALRGIRDDVLQALTSTLFLSLMFLMKMRVRK